MRIELLRDYRGIKTNDELWLKGIYEVEDDLGNYLIGKGYARTSNEPLPEPPVVEPPDAIAVHNKAVGDLDLPSHLKVKPMPDADAPDELAFAKEDSGLASREDLIEMAAYLAIEVKGTGKDGYITMQDLRGSLEGDEG